MASLFFTTRSLTNGYDNRFPSDTFTASFSHHRDNLSVYFKARQKNRVNIVLFFFLITYLLTVGALIVEAQVFTILLGPVLGRCTDLDPIFYEFTAIKYVVQTNP